MEKTIAPSRWYRLIPIAFITYSLAYLDRANFSFGVAGGMEKDLNITPEMSSLLGSLFFRGYFPVAVFIQSPYKGRGSRSARSREDNRQTTALARARRDVQRLGRTLHDSHT